MKVYNRISWDAEGNVVEEDSYEYSGEVAECKGDTKQQTQQLDLQNSLQQQQLNQQNATLDSVKNSLAPYLGGTQGFSPALLSALNSQALDQNASQYNSAGNQVRQALLARGETGQTGLSGTGVAGIAGLLSGKASDAANALRTNQIASAQQALTNQFNANSILSGNANTLAGNVGTFGGGASSALSNLTQKQIADQQNSFLANLSRGLGAGLGGGIASLGTAGLGGGLGSVLTNLGKKAGTSANTYGWGGGYGA